MCSPILPSTYTVEPGRSLTGSWVIAGKYDLSVHGPNGFYRRFAGAAVKSGLHVRADLANHDRGKLVVTIDNPGRSSVEISIADAYRGRSRIRIPSKARRSVSVPTQASGGWYDLMLTIEEQRGYRPSPGSVYPALQMLEEGDFLTGQDIDGKRVYTITDKGSELLAKHRETTEGQPSGEEAGHVELVTRGVHTMVGLKMVLKEIARTRNPQMYAKALAIVERTRRELYELLTAE